LLERMGQPTDLGVSKPHIASLVLCLEAAHIYLLLLVLGNSSGLMFIDLASPGLDWKAWVISGTISGIMNHCLFRSRSKVISSAGLTTMLGAALHVASSLVEPALLMSAMTVLGAALMSGAVVLAIWLQLLASQQLFKVPTQHAAALFSSSFLSPLLIAEIWAVRSLLGTVQTAGSSSIFRFVEGAWIRLYPYTVLIFAMLATHVLWLPVLVRAMKEDRRARPEQAAILEACATRRSPFSRKLLLIPAAGAGVVIGSYRLLAGYPLAGDAHYYLSVLDQIARSGVQSVLSTDRPLLFAILHSLRTCLSIDTELLLKYSLVILTSIFVASTYLFMVSCFNDEGLAILGSFLAATSPHVTIGIRYFIVANWLAMILMMLFFTAILRSIKRKSQVWAVSAIALSWLILGIHFPTWMFMILVLSAHASISYLKRDPSQSGEASPLARIAAGCLLSSLPALVLGLGTPEVSASLQQAWSRTIASLAGMTPLNIIRFLQDEVLLSSYFGYGSYAVPLTYALSLLGLYRLHRSRGVCTRMTLSWAGISSLGLLMIPKFEQWRLLYMMPLQILSAYGLLYFLASVRILKGPSTIDAGHGVWVHGAIPAVSLIAAGAILFFLAPFSLVAIPASTLVGYCLAYDASSREAYKIVATETVLLYVFVTIIAALCSLR